MNPLSKQLRTIFPGPPPSFLIGNLGYLNKHKKNQLPINVFDNLFKEYGDSYTFDFGPVTGVFTRDVDLIKWIYTNDPEKFIKGTTATLLKDLMGQSILLSEGKEWYRKRNLMRNAFKKSALESFLPKFHEGAEELATVWKAHAKENKEIDVLSHFSRLTLDGIGRIGFGVDFSAQMHPGKNQIIQDWNDCFEIFALSSEKPIYAIMGPERF